MAAQFDLRGKVAIVTGASSGIGRATALALARNGAAVVVNYLNNPHGAANTVAEIQAMRRNSVLARADVTQPLEVSRMIGETIQNFGRVDVLVNNAGSAVKLMRTEDYSEEIYDAILNVNLKGTFLCCQAVIPHFKQRAEAPQSGRGGRIINISAIAAENEGMGGMTLYSVAKGAVNTLTKALARELGPYQVTVNAIAPGVVLTPFHDKFSRPARLQEIIEATPLRRAGSPEEVAELAAYLASDEAGFITGEVIGIDGGR